MQCDEDFNRFDNKARRYRKGDEFEDGIWGFFHQDVSNEFWNWIRSVNIHNPGEVLKYYSELQHFPEANLMRIRVLGGFVNIFSDEFIPQMHKILNDPADLDFINYYYNCQYGLQFDVLFDYLQDKYDAWKEEQFSFDDVKIITTDTFTIPDFEKLKIPDDASDCTWYIDGFDGAQIDEFDRTLTCPEEDLPVERIEIDPQVSVDDIPEPSSPVQFENFTITVPCDAHQPQSPVYGIEDVPPLGDPLESRGVPVHDLQALVESFEQPGQWIDIIQQLEVWPADKRSVIYAQCLDGQVPPTFKNLTYEQFYDRLLHEARMSIRSWSRVGKYRRVTIRTDGSVLGP